MPYLPFIDDPEHIERLEGQRFVVLRPATIVSECHRHVQEVVRLRLSGLPASYPARAHVTLAGFADAPLESVQDLVSAWVRDVPPLRIDLEGATAFPAPFQIAFLKIVKTPALFAAMSALRRDAERRGLRLSTVVPVDEWVFHMTLAYCSQLGAADWRAVVPFIEAVKIPAAACVQETVEIVAFDNGREYSGGIHLLSRLSRAKPIEIRE